MKRREPWALIFVILTAGALLLVLPALRPRYEVRLGEYVGTMQRIHSPTAYNPRQNWLIELDDGRSFWVPVPAIESGRQGDLVMIDIHCREVKPDACWARYLGKVQ